MKRLSLFYKTMSNLSDRLQQILNEQNLTIYGASMIVGAETDDEIKTIHKRLTQYLKRPPESWTVIEQTLNALGYKITIEKNTEPQK